MTSIKDALEAALSVMQDAPKSVLRDCAIGEVEEALASLEGDAVERVARIINPDAFCSNPDPDEPEFWRKAARHLAREKARAILATGLVAGEAAIRADEREKCEHRVEELDCLYINDERCPFGGIPADPETSIRREAIKECLAAIRSGDVA